MKLQATGIVDEFGKLTLTAEKKFKADLKAFAKKPVIITVEKKSRKRSIQQLRYYWGVCIDIATNEFRSKGHEITPDIVHEIFKLKFLKTVIPNLETGEPMEYTRSTSSLSTMEFIEYIDAIQRYMIETFDCHIPDPREFLAEA